MKKRYVLSTALQWSVLTFEQHFIAVYVQERVRKSDKEKNRNNNELPDRGEDALAISTRATHALTRAVSAQPLLPSIGFGSVYMKLWNTLCAMSREPHPQISQMATDIINYIANQVDSVAREVSGRGVTASGGSASLPPSPNTRPSPLAPDHVRTLPHHGGRRGKSGLPHTISEDSVAARDPPRDRDRDSASSNSSQPSKKAIVQSQYVEWASTRFGAPDPPPDCEARAHHERAWRTARNRSLRGHAAGLRGLRVPRLETQAFHSRCPLPPAYVQFHPYEQHLAVASKDNFGIWDWGTAAKLCVGTWRKGWGRISALAYLNAHAHALLCVASHAGNVAIYRPSGSITEPALVAAWRALDVRRFFLYCIFVVCVL
ncbi:hypothetical protein evm_006471 [Chilo suppressalis]|nr:hypothetical protein evm_006471 [Chilo suppressalis]